MPTPEPPHSYIEALRKVADRVFPSLDGRSYYQLLNVAETADAATIRSAFFKLAAQLHPDRFHSLPEAALKERLETIYARIGEAYRVLSNPERRAAYDKSLAGGQKRYNSSARETTGPRAPEDSLAHPEAKKFYRLGAKCVGAKDWKGAILNFTFAKNFEPNAAVLAEAIAEATAAQKATAATATGNSGGASVSKPGAR
ncbi:MAG TPA: J domain-containing protein [Polyangia bacterium]